MLKNVTAIDLFCGIGGLTYGIQQAGIKVLAGIDIDSSCKYAYEKNNDSIFINKSIKDIQSSDIVSLFPEKDIKILVGCAPCQPFSNYQKDKGMKIKHKDWNLLNEFLRLIIESKPDIVSMENVPAFISSRVISSVSPSSKDNSFTVIVDIVLPP